MKRFVITVFLIALVTLTMESVALAEQREEYGDPVGIYVGDLGISIISFSDQWSSQDKLESVYNELLANGHGQEMDYLSTIYIYPDSIDGVASYYYDDYYIDEDGFYQYRTDRYIEIFDGDTYTTIEEIARLISHEYGHHFFFYYYIMNENLTKDQWITTDYATIRGLDDLEQVTYLGNSSKTYSHEWDIVEILADDYIQIYGSSLAKATRDYLDVEERVDQDIQNYDYYYQDFNLLPQENLDLPVASDVDGLANYFYRLTGVKPEETIEDISVSAPELLAINSVYGNYNEYIFTWEEISEYEVDDTYEYTLLINELDDNDYPIPIKTVYSGEALIATAGSAINTNQSRAILRNYQGAYEVRLLVKDSNGYMHSSEVVNLSISPKDNASTIFTDISNNYWAENYIYDLTNKGLVKGYPDGTFNPNGSVKISEFITFLIRTQDDVDLFPNANGYDWFDSFGYKAAAVSLGLLDDGDSYVDYNQSITRDEMARLIYIMLDINDIDLNVQTLLYSDVTVDNNYQEISAVKYYGIINGYPDNTYRPNNDASRAEAMKMISVYLTVVDY